MSLFAIMGQKDGPVNFQRSVRDLRKIMGDSRPTHRQSGQPYFWPLIAARYASFLAHFSRPVIGLKTTPVMGFPNTRLGVAKSAANSKRSVRDLRMILGKSRPTRHQSGRPSFSTLIAAKDASILAPSCDFRIAQEK